MTTKGIQTVAVARFKLTIGREVAATIYFGRRLRVIRLAPPGIGAGEQEVDHLCSVHSNRTLSPQLSSTTHNLELRLSSHKLGDRQLQLYQVKRRGNTFHILAADSAKAGNACTTQPKLQRQILVKHGIENSRLVLVYQGDKCHCVQFSA